MSNLTLGEFGKEHMTRRETKIRSTDQDRNELANSGSGDSPENRNNPRETSQVVIVDSRRCLRDALADAFTQQIGVQVSVHKSLAELVKSAVRADEISSIILQLVAGASRPEFELNVCNLRRWAPNVKIVLLADKLTKEIVDLCATLEIPGLVSSEYSTDQIIVCVKVVESGLSYIPANIGRKVIHGDLAKDDDVASVHLPNFDDTLTPRQQQVMRYIALGKSNKHIAAELSLCESTVKVHVSEVMRRLGATSRTHACYIMNRMEHDDDQVLA